MCIHDGTEPDGGLFVQSDFIIIKSESQERQLNECENALFIDVSGTEEEYSWAGADTVHETVKGREPRHCGGIRADSER